MTLLFMLLLLFTSAACGPQAAPTVAPDAFQMHVQVDPEPLAVGDATLIVTLQTAAGEPVDGATLKVHGDMDHEGMMPVDREVSDSANGAYRVPFNWSMGGGWIVTITAVLPDNGGEFSQTFEYFVDAVSNESIINQSGGMNMGDTGAEMTPESTAEAGQ
ncbi:MAG: FixH family protein [Anaerolineaceae bacterium]|nr:FixH family protein [Anaerolineaceae bacterium]